MRAAAFRGAPAPRNRRQAGPAGLSVESRAKLFESHRSQADHAMSRRRSRCSSCATGGILTEGSAVHAGARADPAAIWRSPVSHRLYRATPARRRERPTPKKAMAELMADARQGRHHAGDRAQVHRGLRLARHSDAAQNLSDDVHQAPARADHAAARSTCTVRIWQKPACQSRRTLLR